DAAEIDQMPGGTEFNVLAGPVCENADLYYRFWQVQLDDGSIGWAVEASNSEYFIEPVPPTPTLTNTPSDTFTPTFTSSYTPTNTFTPTITPTPSAPCDVNVGAGDVNGLITSITNANNSPNPYMICLAENSTYTLTMVASGSASGESGLPTITGDLHI